MSPFVDSSQAGAKGRHCFKINPGPTLSAGLIVIPAGVLEAAMLTIVVHRSELQTGTSIRRPSGGWLALGFPGSLALEIPPTQMDTGGPPEGLLA